MKKKRGTKKGEITSQQIVLLIVLIISFAVILYFLFTLNLGKTSDSDVCHNSVTERGSGVIPSESIPLNCKTSYICLTKDGSCEKMTNPQIEKVSTATEVYATLAQQMADCWWMFGEGKLNYVGKDFNSELYCSICSQVVFDNSLTMFPNGQIQQSDFYDYMANTKMSNQNITYLDYLVGLNTAIDMKTTLATNGASFGTIDISKQYYVMMGIFSKVGVLKWTLVAGGAGIVVAGITVATAGVGTIPALIIITGAGGAAGTAGYLMGTKVSGESGNDYISPTIIEADPSILASKLKCASIKTLA